MNSIPENNVKFWRTDNNGQITQDEDNIEQIGKWAMWNKTEDGNGRQLEKMRNEYELVCSSTFFKPRSGGKEELATWYIHNGETKQIDFSNI